MTWWRSGEQHNFGDDLSPLIVRVVSGREVQRVQMGTADLLAIGSLLGIYAKLPHILDRTAILHIWGSGTLHPVNFPHIPYLHVSSVRGPLTRNVVRSSEMTALGDPGLLADRLISSPKEKQYAWGIIPHHLHVDLPIFREIATQTPHSILIDVRDPDTLATVAKIASCERIASTSLHGLIVADAFHIPNFWLSKDVGKKRTDWKFIDYFLSVGRSLFESHPIPDSSDLNELEEGERANYFDIVERTKVEIVAAFPDV